MRIGFVISVYPPEPEPSSVMAQQLVRAWAERGHEVVVICPFPNRPCGKLYPGFRKRLWSTTTVAGVRTIRVLSSFIGEARHPIKRVLENLSFGLSSSLALLLLKKRDVVILETWPLLAQGLGAMVCLIKKTRWINYIKDIYPEAASSAHFIDRNSRAHNWLLRLDKKLCHSSSKNIVISDGMRRYLESSRGLSGGQISVINDWIDLDEIKPYVGNKRWRREVGLREQDFVCLYAGTLGYASRASVLVEVAVRLKERLDIKLVCIGEGILKPEMQARAQQLGLKNLLFLPFQPRERVPEVQSSADVLLLTTSSDMSVSSVPNKFITYLAVGRPVICAVDSDSDIAEVIRENALGRVVKPESAEELCRAILELQATGPRQLGEMGVRARKVAEERFSLSAAIEKFESILSA